MQLNRTQCQCGDYGATSGWAFNQARARMNGGRTSWPATCCAYQAHRVLSRIWVRVGLPAPHAEQVTEGVREGIGEISELHHGVSLAAAGED